MIIVKLQGGLGNQLFQYALARHLREKSGATVKLDLSWYGTQDFRVYELTHLNIEENIATPAEVSRFMRYRVKNGGGILRTIYNTLIANPAKYWREKSSDFDPRVLEIRDDCYLDGIWVSEKYFENIGDIIKKEFTLKTPLSKEFDPIRERIRATESVSVCIRRTDFATDAKVHSVHGMLPMKYYEDAIGRIAGMVTTPVFFVFSDDIEWAKNNFHTGFETHYVSDPAKLDACQQVDLMKECKHDINANSSFSWWASWLNQNANKIVLFPEKWFRQDTKNSPDLVPESWVRIPNTHV